MTLKEPQKPLCEQPVSFWERVQVIAEDMRERGYSFVNFMDGEDMCKLELESDGLALYINGLLARKITGLTT